MSPNTTYKVRVQHEGNLLDPSEQSGTVTITTGASRNAHEIVTSDIDMLKEWQEEVIKEEYNHIQNAEAIAAIVDAKRDHLACKVLCETEYCASICDAQFAADVAQTLNDYDIGGN